MASRRRSRRLVEESTARAIDDSQTDDQTIYSLKPGRRRFHDKKSTNGEADDDRDTGDDHDETSDTDADETGSEKESLEAEEDDADADADLDDASSGVCIFCGQDELHDPSDEFEEYLSCQECGKHAHRQCARDQDAFDDVDDLNDADKWTCPQCPKIPPDEENNDKYQPNPAEMLESGAQLLTQEGSSRSSRPNISHINGVVDSGLSTPIRSSRKRRLADNEGAGVSEDTVPETPLAVAGIGRGSARKARTNAAIAIAASARPRRYRTAATIAAESLSNSSNGRSLSDHPFAKVLVRQPKSLIVAFLLDPAKLKNVLSQTSRKPNGERGGGHRMTTASQTTAYNPMAQFNVAEPHYPTIQLNLDSLLQDMFLKSDPTKSKPYGGLLTSSEADTSKTFPQYEDRKLFEDARLRAESQWQAREKEVEAEEKAAAEAEAVAAAEAAAATEEVQDQKQSSTATSRRRQQRRQNRETQHPDAGQPCKIKCINFGGYEIETWHAAPYPEEYTRNRVLYICEFCLKYMSSDYVAWRHKLKCPDKHPPGDEIYRDGEMSFFEVDGRKNPVYCQNLCLLSKLFLGSKTLYYDVEPFLFYIMTITDEYGCHVVGYFSKEKRRGSTYNVSCILVLPIYQRRGFGHLLIDFSYLLSRLEKKAGSPEKPLSDMGLVSYRGYWRLVISQQLLANEGADVSILELSRRTGMTADDVVSALEGLRALMRDPVTGTYAIAVDYSYLKDYVNRHEAKKWPSIKPSALVWSPYVMNIHGPFEDHEDADGNDLHSPHYHQQEMMFDENGEPIAESVESPSGHRRRSFQPLSQSILFPNGSGNVSDSYDGIPDDPVPASIISPSNSPPAKVRPEHLAGLTFDDRQNKGIENGKSQTGVPIPAASDEIPLSRFKIFPPPEQLAGLVSRNGGGGIRFESIPEHGDENDDPDNEDGDSEDGRTIAQSSKTRSSAATRSHKKRAATTTPSGRTRKVGTRRTPARHARGGIPILSTNSSPSASSLSSSSSPLPKAGNSKSVPSKASSKAASRLSTSGSTGPTPPVVKKKRGRPPLPEHIRLQREKDRRKLEREKARMKRAEKSQAVG